MIMSGDVLGMIQDECGLLNVLKPCNVYTKLSWANMLIPISHVRGEKVTQDILNDSLACLVCPSFHDVELGPC